VYIKKGLKRLWMVLSVFWFFDVFRVYMGNSYERTIILNQQVYGIDQFAVISIFGLVLMWGLLYMGFWISSGFSGDDKKEGKTDE